LEHGSRGRLGDNGAKVWSCCELLSGECRD
jgi:hypothetical protein